MSAVKTIRVDWTLEELLEILGSLDRQNLLWFVQPLFPNEELDNWKEEELVELGLGAIQQWEKRCKEPGEFLVSVAQSLCRNSFEAFVRFFWDEVPGSQRMMWGWFMNVYCNELQTVASEIFQYKPRPHDLICNVPPGQSKSTIWSILFPCWVWTRMPKAALITASHTDSLVTDLASKSRDVMRSGRYRALFPEIVFSESLDSKGHYRNTLGGERFTCTIAGKSPTGKHCHFALVDDPIDPKKVLSEAERKTAADFMTKVMPSRRMRGKEGDVSVMMLIMQRLGIDDPTDVMLEISKHRGAWSVRHVCLPAELTDDVSPPELRKYYLQYNMDAGKNPEGLLDPIRLSRTALDEQRAILGEWAYAGQFLQKPRPIAGGMFKVEWFSRRCNAAPFNSKRIRYYDRASSRDTSACATAGVLMAYDGEKIYVEDVVYGRWEPDERNAVMLATAQRDRTKYGKYEPTIYVEAEGGSSGRDAWLGVVRTLIGFPVKEDRVQGSKDTRAEPWSCQLAAGNVWMVDNGASTGMGRCSWDIEGYVEDHLHFRPTPGSKLGREKDRVDASCLVAGTMVETEKGVLPIEDVIIGDRVLTRKGYKKVLWSGCSGRADKLVSILFSNGAVITGTPEHLVLTKCRGFVKLIEVESTDEVMSSREFALCPERNTRKNVRSVELSFGGDCRKSAVLQNAVVSVAGTREGRKTSMKRSNSMEWSFEGDFQMEGTTLEKEGTDCTEQCGNSIMGLFPVAITFITRMKTRWITELKILNVSLLKNMLKDIPITHGKEWKSIWKILEEKQQSGIHQKKVGNGIDNMGKIVGRTESQRSMSVKSAERNSNLCVQGTLTESNSVLQSVLKERGTRVEDERRSKYVSSAEKHIWEAIKASFVDIPVPPPGSGPIEVYDLKIEDQHEFFANGILVHNSGAFNLLVGVKRAFPALRTLALRTKQGSDTRYIVVCMKEELPLLEVDNKASLILSISDPEVYCLAENKETEREEGKSLTSEADACPIILENTLLDLEMNREVNHRLPKNLGQLEVSFADVNPANYLGPDYEKPIPPWNKKIDELQLSREVSKQMWSFFFKKYDVPWGVLVLVDKDGNLDRALSVAYGIADGLHLPRSVIHIFGEEGTVCTKEDEPANEWIFNQIKLSKCFVVES